MTAYSFTLPGMCGDLSFKLNLDPANPSEKAIIDFASKGNAYEPDICHVFLRALRPGDVVWDVGANVGFFTILAAHLVGPSGKVIAFEPDSNNITRLRANINLNGLGNVEIIEKAVTDSVGEIEFFFNKDSNGGNALWNPLLFPGNREAFSKVVSATTLDEEFTRLGLVIPRLIKIDTEGAEEKILKGACNILNNNVPFIITELHETGLNIMGSSQNSLRNLMLNNGYFTFALYYKGFQPKLIHPFTQLDSPYILNLLFARPENVALLWPIENHDPTL